MRKTVGTDNAVSTCAATGSKASQDLYSDYWKMQPPAGIRVIALVKRQNKSFIISNIKP